MREFQSKGVPIRFLVLSGLVLIGLSLGASPVRGQPARAHTTTECENGTAGTYPCENVDLLAHLSIDALGGDFSTQINDIWGWTDPQSGDQFALVGRTDGVAFVDVTQPTDPVYVGELPTHSGTSTWRDVKVYDNHAFIVSEAFGHGMQVFDLTQLPDVPPSEQPRTFTETAHYDEVEAAHNIVVNRTTGFAYIVGGNGGGNTCGGGLHMVNIQSPTDPSFAGCFSDATNAYTHDAQCVVYQGPDLQYWRDEVCFNANESVLNIAEVTNKDDPETITNATYPLTGYVHQAWLTDDHNYLYVDDELDEMQGLVDQTRTLVFDVSDLDNPELVETHYGSTGAIDHNQYIEDGYSYQANYQSGLRILDVSDPESPEEVGYFDTYPSGNEASFDGAWSTYPFVDSNVVLISSIGEGLFVVQPEMTAPEPTLVRFASDSTAVAEDAGPDTLTVELAGSAPTAGIEVDVAFADTASSAGAEDLDGASTQTVSFPASASTGTTRSVAIAVSDDGAAETNEVARFDLTNLSTSGNAETAPPTRAAVSIVGDDRTFADARAALEEGTAEEVILHGTVSRAFGSYARVQDDSGPTGASAVVVQQTSGSLSSAFRQDIQDGVIQPGTELRVRGVLSASGGQVRFHNDDVVSYAVQGQGAPPVPQSVTLSDLTGSDGEDYESELVRVTGLSFPTASGTFSAGTNYMVSSGATTIPFRVSDSTQSALPGTAIPDGPFAYEGVLGQSSGSLDSDEGYRLLPIRPATALPVEFASFDAVETDASVVLTWATARETDNAGFNVQQRTESGWTTLGFVESNVDGGSTTDPEGLRDYRYTVPRELNPGTHRFRLEQEDLDGSTSFSPIETVDVDMDAALHLSTPAPNPAAGSATVSLRVKESAEVTVALYNVLGRRVKTLFRGTPPGGQTETVPIPVGALSSGVYFVRMEADGRTRTERLTVLR